MWKPQHVHDLRPRQPHLRPPDTWTWTDVDGNVNVDVQVSLERGRLRHPCPLDKPAGFLAGWQTVAQGEAQAKPWGSCNPLIRQARRVLAGDRRTLPVTIKSYSQRAVAKNDEQKFNGFQDT